LESLHTEVLKVLYFHIFAESKMKEDDTKTKYEVLRDIISDIEECMSDFPENLYNNLGLYKDNPFDHDKLKYILGEFNGPSDQSIISGFSETLKPTDSKIQEVLEEKKQQLEFINTRII
jgi:hypothetical protein